MKPTFGQKNELNYSKEKNRNNGKHGKLSWERYFSYCGRLDYSIT